MATRVSSGLKTTFLLHALFGSILGAIYLLAPGRWGAIIGWPAAQPFDHRVIGCAFLAFGFASWLACGEDAWERVRIVVLMEILFCVLATLLMIWGLLTLPMPALGWLYVLAVGLFAAAFALFYRQHAGA